MTNNIEPTAKIVMYPVDPVGWSPNPAKPMNEDMVCIGTPGSNEKFAVLPAANNTIVVCIKILF